VNQGRNTNTVVRRRLLLEGCVQGMGFRPNVYRLARDRALAGFVANSSGALCIEAQGELNTVRQFFCDVRHQQPAQAVITRSTESNIACNNEKQFVIRQSSAASHSTQYVSAQGFETRTDSTRAVSTEAATARAFATGEISARALPLGDIATCKECIAEIFDPSNRRYHYPFNNCVNCGPRYTIQRTIPYDRVNTSMDGFTLCNECQREFDNPADRRFHAQPIACPACGPALSLIDHGTPLSESCASVLVSRTVEALNSGAIVALKGIGGFQLLVDARNSQAIARLRSAKFRASKPFAVMMPSANQVHCHVRINKTELTVLESPQAPIVLLEKRVNADSHQRLSQHIAPDNHYFGVMLPYSPLHHLLLAKFNAPLVVTSGNRGGEPLVTDNEAALAQLGDIADMMLLHNRPIVNAADDSIVQVVENRVQTLRLARGYAPFALKETAHTNRARYSIPTVALGGQQKSSIAIATAGQIVSGPYIGDMGTDAARQRYLESLEQLQNLLAVKPHRIACDKHPDYFTSQLAADLSLPTRKIQHHHAHAYACIAEHNLHGPTTAIIWDGTGYGDDNRVWGGECFHIECNTTTRHFTLLPFPLPGAERAVLEPRRSAAGVLYVLFGNELFTHCKEVENQFSTDERPIVLQMLEKLINTPMTTSIGRLFDAVASLIGLVQRSEHEGQAPMVLEHLAAQSAHGRAYPIAIDNCSDLQYSDLRCIDWRPMINSILEDIKTGTSSSEIAAKFHHTLSDLVVTLAKQVGNAQVVLSGGCFQNKYLSEHSIRSLRKAGFTPFWHEKIPPNDGGLAVGQALCADSAINSESLSCV